MNLNALWKDIADEQSHRGTPGLSVRRVDPRCPDDLFAGIRTPAGTRIFLLRLPSPPQLPRDALPQSRGFVVHLARFEHDPEHSCSLVLETTHAAFNAVFSVLAEDLVRNIVARGTEQSALSVFISSLQHWKRFFDAAGPEGMSEEKLHGLFGELGFLRDFAIRNTPSAEVALRGWVGPDPLSKDFEYPGCAVEVKATSSREPVKIRINGERQLDNQGTENLFLVVLLTEKAAGGGLSVPEVVDSVRASLPDGGSARLLFEEKLLAYGYHDIHRTRYESSHFISHGIRLYQVRPEFPRLTSLPSGVGDISYTVTLSACEPFRIRENVLSSVLRSVPT